MIEIWNRGHAYHVFKRTKKNFLEGEISTYIIHDTRHILPTKERHNVQFREKGRLLKKHEWGG